jgi:hypothetical protein
MLAWPVSPKMARAHHRRVASYQAITKMTFPTPAMLPIRAHRDARPANATTAGRGLPSRPSSDWSIRHQHLVFEQNDVVPARRDQ